MRSGIGIDVHAFGGDAPVILCGVIVDEARGLAGTSDADVAAHAIADAILGAAVLDDLGTHFPPNDPASQGADSMRLLSRVVTMAWGEGFAVTHVDVTIICQSIRIGPHRVEMRERLAEAVGIPAGQISVKATTTDGLGLIGRDEGVAAMAIATVAAQGDRSE